MNRNICTIGTRVQQAIAELTLANHEIPEWVLWKLAKNVALDAGAVCDARASCEDKPFTIRCEATNCGCGIRHVLICIPGQSICLRCDGYGCDACEGIGVVEHQDELMGLSWWNMLSQESRDEYLKMARMVLGRDKVSASEAWSVAIRKKMQKTWKGGK